MKCLFRLTRQKKWVDADRPAKLLSGAQDNRNAKTVSLGNNFRNKSRKPFENSRRRAEDDVSALDISAHLRATSFSEDLGQFFHGQQIPPADIHPTQQRDVFHRFLSFTLHLFSNPDPSGAHPASTLGKAPARGLLKDAREARFRRLQHPYQIRPFKANLERSFNRALHELQRLCANRAPLKEVGKKAETEVMTNKPNFTRQSSPSTTCRSHPSPLPPLPGPSPRYEIMNATPL